MTGRASSWRDAGIRWILLAWAVLLAAIVISFGPDVPVIWGDTPPFVESAYRTLEAAAPVVAGGRDPGYPVVVALTAALGGDLATVVRLQQAAWAVLMLVLAATAQAATRAALSLVPIVLVATYPGLLLFRNVITAELLYAVVLNLATAGLVLAACAGKPARCWFAAAAILCAALAACFRSQGFLGPMAAIPLGAWLARPDTPARRAVVALSVAAALVLLADGSRLGASNSDAASVVFVPKTLFCNHLNVVLASDTARREIASSAGDRAEATLARLGADIAAEPERWPVLGFFGDSCLFDSTLDRDFSDASGNPAIAAKTYWRIFFAALRDRPLAYARKVVRQMAYGVLRAWPPYGLEPIISVSTDDVPHVAAILARHGRAVPSDPQGEPVRIGLLADHPSLSAGLYRALSAAFGIAIIFWLVTAARRRHPGFAARAGIVTVMWTASILPAAAAHTLDVWRYLVPSVPMVGLMLSLIAVELADAVVLRSRRTPTRGRARPRTATDS